MCFIVSCDDRTIKSLQEHLTDSEGSESQNKNTLTCKTGNRKNISMNYGRLQGPVKKGFQAKGVLMLALLRLHKSREKANHRKPTYGGHECG